MNITLHKKARTTPAIGQEIQQSELSERKPTVKHGISRDTVRVKPRMIAFQFFKQVRMSFPPLAESLHRRDMAEVSLRNIGVVYLKTLDQSLFELPGRFKAGLLNNFFDSAVEAFRHAVCLRFSRLDQAMLNAVLRAFLIKDMFSSRLPLTRRTEPVCELLAVGL